MTKKAWIFPLVGALLLLATTVPSAMAVSNVFYADQTSFETYFNTSRITTSTDIVEIYFDEVPLNITIDYSGELATITAVEGGGPPQQICSCVQVWTGIVVCADHDEEDLLYINATVEGIDGVMNFKLEEHDGIHFIEANGGIDVDNNLRWRLITDDGLPGTPVATIKLDEDQ